MNITRRKSRDCAVRSQSSTQEERVYLENKRQIQTDGWYVVCTFIVVH